MRAQKSNKTPAQMTDGALLRQEPDDDEEDDGKEEDDNGDDDSDGYSEPLSEPFDSG